MKFLQTVCGNEALSRNNEFEKFKPFKIWREDFKDDLKSGRPSTPGNAATISNVGEMVTRDRRWALRMMTDELNINKETIRQILPEDLRKRKTCAKFDPHTLTSCQDFIQTCQENPSFLDCNVTGDESWVFQYDPETKRQSMQ
jgi:hypothetical protein